MFLQISGSFQVHISLLRGKNKLSKKIPEKPHREVKFPQNEQACWLIS
jgi:hypothetical protein